MHALLTEVRHALESTWDRRLPELRYHPVGGGCINQTGFLGVGETDRRAFLKVHAADRLPNFQAEAAGLEEIAATGTIRVPRPICHGTAGSQAFLVLEALDLTAPVNRGAAEHRLGSDLAALHRVRGDEFGWTRDNVIGDTFQRNTREADWPSFFRKHRLGYQIELARSKGLRLPGASALLEGIPDFFTRYQPVPSLLHGDLWSGNIGYERAGRPVVYDPAVYYGDRETDIAFTEMFGGLGKAFYDSYERRYPLDPGYAGRRDLYNLYHILNHYNLFGGHYGDQAQSVIARLLQRRRERSE